MAAYSVVLECALAVLFRCRAYGLGVAGGVRIALVTERDHQMTSKKVLGTESDHGATRQMYRNDHR